MEASEKWFEIVTDSAHNLPKEILQSSGVAEVPFTVMHGSHSLLDGEFSLEEFLVWLEQKRNQGYPTTAAPSIGRVLQPYYNWILKEGKKNVLAITLSSGLSSTHSSFAAAVRIFLEVYPNPDQLKLRVLDSRLATVAQGFLILEAIKCREAGMGIDETVEMLVEKRKKCHMIIGFEDPHHLVKSGRVNKYVAQILILMHIRPVFTLDQEGLVKLVAKPRGSITKALDAILENVRKANDQVGLARIAVVQGVADDMSQYLVEGLRSFVPDSLEIPVFHTSTALLVHSGPRAAGICWQEL